MRQGGRAIRGRAGRVRGRSGASDKRALHLVVHFPGFPPRGPGALRNWFAEDRDKEHTLVCYESPFRVAATLEAALDALGDREAAVCIELTKLHERVSRGYLSDLVAEFRGAKVKGEVAIVIAGCNPKFARQSTEPTNMV